MKGTHGRATLWFITSFVVAFGLLAGCEDGAMVDGDTSESAALTTMRSSETISARAAHFSNGSITTVASFDGGAGELPEGIAVDAFGNIYVSMSGLGEIWKLDPSGEFVEIVASFDLNEGDSGVLGLRFDTEGTLFAAVFSTNPDVNGVWRITPTGQERLDGTEEIVFPNDVDVTPNGTVYITDSATGAVWRYADGGPAVMWVQDEMLEGTGAFGLGVPVGANGLVAVPGKQLPVARELSGPSKGGVVVANSEKGQLVYVPILPDGSAGEPVIMIADEDLFGLDGITLDARGAIYGALNVANTIVRIERDGSGFRAIASGEPLDFPAGLAWGTGGDEHTLFVASFAIIHFLSDPPTPEAAHPGVQAIHVGPPGRTR